MKLASLFPRDDTFYSLLERQSSHTAACSKALRQFVQSGTDAERDAAAKAIDDLRTQSKLLAAEITEELCRSFITPFDREDIQDISDLLYKIPKIIEKVKDRVQMHGIISNEGDFIKQVELIVEEAAATEELVKSLVSGKNKNDVVAIVARLRDLEQQGDKIRNDLMVSLFKSDREIRDLLLRRDIYDMLEKVVDRFRDVAGVALQIVLKHS